MAGRAHRLIPGLAMAEINPNPGHLLPVGQSEALKWRVLVFLPAGHELHVAGHATIKS